MNLKGERDLTLDEIQREAERLFGPGALDVKHGIASVAKGRNNRCVVGMFHRDDLHLEMPYRRQVVLGEGSSFAEAFARAEKRLRGETAPTLGGVDQPISFPTAAERVNLEALKATTRKARNARRRAARAN